MNLLKKLIVYKTIESNTKSDNEWQRVTTSGNMGDHEWQQMTTSDSK